jgi:hypothetical protein
VGIAHAEDFHIAGSVMLSANFLTAVRTSNSLCYVPVIDTAGLTAANTGVSTGGCAPIDIAFAVSNVGGSLRVKAIVRVATLYNVWHSHD